MPGGAKRQRGERPPPGVPPRRRVLGDGVRPEEPLPAGLDRRRAL